MNFVSFEFLVLLAAVLALHPFLDHRQRNTLLLMASLAFCAFGGWPVLALLLGVAAVNFLLALAIEGAGRRPGAARRRRALVAAAVAANLGALGVVKYAGFFTRSLNEAAAWLGGGPWVPVVEFALPLGISFYTFKTLSYTVDVYRGVLPARRAPSDFLLFVSFFPEVVAGPIDRAPHLLPQVEQARRRARRRLGSGAQLALVGYFKKMVIADNVAPLVTALFALPGWSGPQTLLAGYAFALQIYCDFSGYTDIGRGVGRMLGFELAENFRLPYLASNPSEFWRRWHITLSSWLRDYLYIPLGGNRSGLARTGLNLLVTMLLGGLWHGAAWHFVLWGGYHGALLIGYRLFQARRGADTRDSAGAWHWARVVAFFHLTCLGWLLFRAPTVGSFSLMVQGLLDGPSWACALAASDVLWVAVPGLSLLAFQLYQRRVGMEPWERWRPCPRAVFAGALVLGILALGQTGGQEFIYAQF